MPAVGAALAIVLTAIAGKTNSTNSGESTTIVCYLTAIALFTATAMRDYVKRDDADPLSFRSVLRFHPRNVLLRSGLVLAIVLDAVGCKLVYRSLEN